MALLTQETKDKIIELFQSGISGLKIAEMLKVGKNTVFRVLEKAGIGNRSQRKYKFSPEIEAEIVEKYKQGKSLNELGKEYNADFKTIHVILKRYDVQFRPRGSKFYEFSKMQRKQIEKWHAEGRSVTAMAENLMVHSTVVMRYLDQKGLIPNKRIGETHQSWKGGKTTNYSGYYYIYLDKSDPFYCMADSRGYVFEHRYLMAKHLGRPLLAEETVHHTCGDKQCTNIDHLELRSSPHGNGEIYKCGNCGCTKVEPY